MERTLTADQVAAMWARPAIGLGDAALLLGISRSSLCRMMDRGELTRRKLGGRVFVITDELRGLLGVPTGNDAA